MKHKRAPHDYTVIVERLPDSEGGGFIARVLDLPGCMSDGDTDIEALENAHDAITAWIDCARQMGRPVPHPTAQRVYA